MTQETLVDACRVAIEAAMAQGATGAEAWAERAVATEATLEQSDIKGATVAEHEAIGLRVLVGDQLGFAYVNRLNPDALRAAAADALAIAKSSRGDPANALPVPRPLPHVADLYDPSLAAFTATDVVQTARALLAAARDRDDRVSVDGSVTVGEAWHAIASTTGVEASARETFASYGLVGMAIDGDDIGSYEHLFRGTRARAEIDATFVGQRFAENAIALLGAQPGKSYRGKVLLSSEAVDDILLGTVISALDGDEVQKGKSRLKGRLGALIAAPSVSIYDDGTRAGALGSAAFDREGQPHTPLGLIENGVLGAFLYDARAARRAGVASTGHAQGSARAMPTIGTTNLTFAPDDHDEAALFSLLGDGIFVRRFSGSTDAVSGEFSGVAKGSFLVERGEKTVPLRETLISGNAFTALTNVVAIGSMLHPIMATRCPWVLIDGVEVTAA